MTTVLSDKKTKEQKVNMRSSTVNYREFPQHSQITVLSSLQTKFERFKIAQNMHPGLNPIKSPEETLQNPLLVTNYIQHDTRLTKIQDIGHFTSKTGISYIKMSVSA